MSMLKWAVIMLLVSLVAALFGFTDLAAASADVARVLFYIFAVIFLVLLVLGMTILRRQPRRPAQQSKFVVNRLWAMIIQDVSDRSVQAIAGMRRLAKPTARLGLR